MLNLQETILKLRSQRRAWETALNDRPVTRDSAEQFPHFAERLKFGSNPGELRMFSYVPPSLETKNPALVVVLHGCTQTAREYATDSGWKTLADRYGFCLLLPQQQAANNPNGCFNWFQPGDTRRDQGEALSIRQMLDAFVEEQSVDRSRVFVTGLSAGGAMTAVMLACYPEVFAGGAIIAGLPYGTANSVQGAFQCMANGSGRSGADLASLVHDAAPGASRWPRISVWHGSADRTVASVNSEEILNQWVHIHQLEHVTPARSAAHGAERVAWADASGVEIIEAYLVPGMGHGTPIASGNAHNQCGEAAPYVLDVGIASSFHTASFFGLTQPEGASVRPRDVQSETRRSEKPSPDAPIANPQPAHRPGGALRDVIDKALRAAGLIR